MSSLKIPYGEITKTTLAIVAAAGIISLVLVAPGVAQASRLFNTRPRREQKQTTDRILRRLKRRGLIRTFIKDNGSEYVRLTEKGQAKVLQYELHQRFLTKKRWDGSWRIVLFDIRESKNYLRDRLRLSLRAFGFIRLQDSVWIFPHECEEVIELVRSMLGLRAEVLCLVSRRFRGDTWLCREFDLPEKKRST